MNKDHALTSHYPQAPFVGVDLTATISPCSWMYPGYGFQIKVTLPSGEAAYPCRKGLAFEEATEADMVALVGEVKLCKCSNPECNNPTFDLRGQPEGKERSGECWACRLPKLEEALRKAQEVDEAEVAAMDAEHKSRGFTHKIVAWVHPEGAGDDFQVIQYQTLKPTDAEARKLLKKHKSTVLTDYSFHTL